MLEEILLLSGNDIPFFPARINIHQPTIKEIAYIGEESFFIGCQLLNFSKEVLSEEDRINLADTDDFDILMSIVCDEEVATQRMCATMVLSLLFPDYTVNFMENGIHLFGEEDSAVINKENFPEFREIFKQVFGLEKSKTEEFHPKDEAARKIAEKLKKGREKVAAAKSGGNKKIAILSRYISILAIGLKMDLKNLFNHTVYQLYDEFKRFQMYQSFDLNIKARMAGATDLEEVDNWMDDIHS